MLKRLKVYGSLKLKTNYGKIGNIKNFYFDERELEKSLQSGKTIQFFGLQSSCTRDDITYSVCQCLIGNY